MGDQKKIDPVEGLEKYRKTTEKVVKLPEDLKLPNGWTKKELIIHLWAWDKEFIDLTSSHAKACEVPDSKGFILIGTHIELLLSDASSTLRSRGRATAPLMSSTRLLS